MASSSEAVPVSPLDTAAPCPEEQSNTNLVRQSSVYSLTLDEFQHTVCEPGKNFGSMNMDEFIANIWTVEESQAVAAAMEAAQSNPNDGETPTAITRQPSLHRQGSLTIPAPLSRKTVEEVWSEIHRDRNLPPQSNSTHSNTNNNHPNDGNHGNAARQPTFGEMTLEDFLIKAGVVREGCSSSSQQQQQPFGYFRNNNGVEQEFAVSGNVMGYGYADHRNTAKGGAAGSIQAYQAFPQQQAGAVIGEGMSNFGGNAGRNGGFPGGCFGGRMGNGGGIAGGFGVGCGSPVSPVPSDGMCGGASQGMDNSVSQFGMEMGVGGSGGVMRGSGSRKRGADGEPLEKGVERRQRRMIKNRESAARSRARKQAYTVELEAELEMLKEENARLRKEQEEEEARRKKKILEAMMAKVAPTKGMKPKPLRRTFTGPW
ncbi:protein ABSCISIC ACID-INSENSITIVE 5-like [Magnolia sinica]|uniref:protein ABSCISIC ACID-INSENSITIVE 5-like n=1 Tax=Magnolia sinica TaxID=86752 RepID=UPI002657B208|nr:protein ABSCISIC ACID-INSENSITIVE 5-like [Magnolia sinica]